MPSNLRSSGEVDPSHRTNLLNRSARCQFVHEIVYHKHGPRVMGCGGWDTAFHHRILAGDDAAPEHDCFVGLRGRSGPWRDKGIRAADVVNPDLFRAPAHAALRRDWLRSTHSTRGEGRARGVIFQDYLETINIILPAFSADACSDGQERGYAQKWI